jgi:cold shock protein
MSDLHTGKVIWFNKLGHGFLEWEIDGVKQKDMFVHYSDLEMDGFKMLNKDQLVSFEIGLNHRGQPKGINVKPVK